MDHIDQFFAEYPTFDYHRSESSCSEFHRMCNHFGWAKDRHGNYPPERVESYDAFRRAMVECFNNRFGSDVEDQRAWESICAILGVYPIPPSVEGMKEVLYRQFGENRTDMNKVVRNTHVNLADLLDGGRSGGEVQTFDSQKELAAYTINESRFFPKEEAYAGGVLKYLLREILGTYQGHKGRMSKRKRGRGKR